MSVEKCDDAINKNIRANKEKGLLTDKAMDTAVEQAYSSGACIGYEVEVQHNFRTDAHSTIIEPAPQTLPKAPKQHEYPIIRKGNINSF